MVILSFAAISFCLVSPSCSKEGVTIDSADMLPKIFLWRAGITSGDGVLKEIVNKWTLEEVRNKEALEIIYYYRMGSYSTEPVINTHGKKTIDNNIKQRLIEGSRQKNLTI